MTSRHKRANVMWAARTNTPSHWGRGATTAFRATVASPLLIMAMAVTFTCVFANADPIIPVAPAADLAQEIDDAPGGAILVLEGDEYELLDTVVIDKVLTIQGYDADICEILPLQRILLGEDLEDCFDDVIENPDFEDGPVDWDFDAILTAGVEPDYTGPIIDDIITQDGAPQEGDWHAWFDLEAKTADVELQYIPPIPTLPETVTDELRWEGHDITGLCTILDLVTEPTYTLPVLPPVLREEYTAADFPADSSAGELHVWVHVLQWSGHADDRMEVYVNGALEMTADATDLENWELQADWVRWSTSLSAPAGDDLHVRIETATRTDQANPTLVLIGAVNVNSDADPAAPDTNDSVAFFNYASNIGDGGALVKGIHFRPVDVAGVSQMAVARAGGLGTPYLAASMRVAGPVGPDAGTVQLHYGNHQFPQIPLADLPEAPDVCARYEYTLPAAVLNTPGRPRVRVQFAAEGEQSNVIVDAFTLSYVTPALDAYPDIAADANIIVNGNFESGTYPFLIESPVATGACPHISDIIRLEPDACQGDRAAVFQPPSLTLWLRTVQSSSDFEVNIIVEDTGGNEVSRFTIDDPAALPQVGWEAVSIPLQAPEFNIIVSVTSTTNVPTPLMLLVGALELRMGAVMPDALPSPNALPVTDAVPVPDPALAGLPPNAIPDILLEAPLAVLAGHTHVARLGGLGTTVRFDLRLENGNIPGGNGAFAVHVSGAETWSISDAALSEACNLFIVTPDYFPVETEAADFIVSFFSRLLANPAPFAQTEIMMDNACLSYVAVDPTRLTLLNLNPPCYGNQIVHGDFEAPLATLETVWDTPDDTIDLDEVIMETEACDGTLPNFAAVFTGIQKDPPVWEITLEQDIDVPMTTGGDLLLKFYLKRVRTSTEPGEFAVELNGDEIFRRSTEDMGVGAYSEYVVDITAHQGPPDGKTLRFTAQLPRTMAPPSFALDNIRICEETLTGALFEVIDDGDLTLQSVTLERAERGVDVLENGVLRLLQSKVRGMAGNGIEVAGGNALLVSAVLHANRGDGLHVHDGGRAVALQCTIRENNGAGVFVGPDGTAHVAASLIDGNGRGIQVDAAGTARSYVNWVRNNDNEASPVPNYEDVDADDLTPNYRDTPWRGKLSMPMLPPDDATTLNGLVVRLSAVISGLATTNVWERDFECDMRDRFAKVQIGADEVDPTPITCPPDSLGAEQNPHLPTEPWNAFASNNSDYVKEYTPAEQFGAVRHIAWWGIWRDGAGNPCTPPIAMTFEITSYDGPGGSAGDAVQIIPPRQVLPEYDYDGAALVKYEFFFDRDDFYREEYLSIRALVDPADDCFFYWVTSKDGMNDARNASGDPINANLSLCISEYMSSDDCFDGAFITQEPVHTASPWPYASLSTEDNPMFERINNPFGGISLFEFWGVWLDETGQVVCAPSGDIAVAYTDVSNLADATDGEVIRPAGNVFEQEADAYFPSPDGVGEDVPLYRYTFVPESPLIIDGAGWISAQQTNMADSQCRFYWVHSDFGIGQAVTWQGPGTAPSPQGVSMSLCLGSAPAPSVDYCEADDIIGRDQTGTVTLFGSNLMMLDTVLLLPEMPWPGESGNETEPTHHVDLMYSPVAHSVSFTGRLGEEMEVNFRMPGPFNAAVSGDEICTDGRAFFAAVIDGVADTSSMNCETLIDTVPPVLFIMESTPLENAASGSPYISANRVPPPFTLPDWAPSFPLPTVPKNNAPFHPADPAGADMHLYLNPGYDESLPYSMAALPGEDLWVQVNARFTDNYPVDGNGNVYPVEISGFIPNVLDVNDMSEPDWGPTRFPTHSDPATTRGTARWSGSAPGLLPGTPEATFTPVILASGEQQLSARWEARFEAISEPWRARFKLEAQDLAGNVTDGDDYNAINLHWLWRTRARFQTQMDMTVQMPEIHWSLYRPFADLPGARPDCAPMAMFRLYVVVDEDTGELSGPLGESGWRAQPLRGNTLFNGTTLQTLVEQHQGAYLCLTIQGADETGNVQHYPAANNLTELDFNEVDYIVWRSGERLQPNLAVDTSVRVELFHERADAPNVRYRNFGPATRVPLPPLAEACDTRVNAAVTMRAMLPTADQRMANVTNMAILWKLYCDGALVARGTRTPGVYNLMEELLLPCNTAGSAAEMPDYGGDGFFRFIDDPFCERLGAWTMLGGFPPSPPYCDTTFFNNRLGDEGDPPDDDNPNLPSQRRREMRYRLTAQTVLVYRYTDADGTLVEDVVIDQTPATASFSIYVRSIEPRDEAPVREFSR